ncbi:LysR family transcriptional regulator [Bradyrhizobium sp. WYCCWR 13022]|uniref:LysR family transcriptional regulator n=1 Tax=unclassified Bradyrhizobium TaxID=2631580 RepID=UPI00263BAB48|nr:LysR family transcriptional regulator [Bradyrhizobium sp. WYCCWR 13022]MDN4984312.1 LysR family transcriptional regulator [Bradyrhizobium sp. WYCCWR 13022]
MDRRLARNLDILTLQLFVAICEEGSLTRAARREGIAPSAVSKRIADLEVALEAELLHRGTTGMVLTSAGETMLRYSRSVLRTIQTIGTELQEYARGHRGFVRLRANMGTIVQFLPEELESFFAANNRIRVDLAERSSHAVVDEIEKGQADIGLCSSIVESSCLSRIPYRTIRLVLVTRDDHPLAVMSKVSILDTLSYPHIGLEEHSAVHKLMSSYAQYVSKQLNTRLHVSGFDAQLRMIQAGLGIGFMPAEAFNAIGKPMGLVSLELTDIWARRQIDIVYRGEESLSAAGKLLLHHLTESGSRHVSDDQRVSPPLLAGLPDWGREFASLQ